MELIIVYIVLALTTTIWANYELFIPIMQELEILNPTDVLIQNKKMAYFVFALIAFMFAPLFIIVVLVPSISGAFKHGLLNNLVPGTKI